MLKKTQIANRVANPEQGVALLFCIFALLILTAITASLIMMSGTETSVNANYRTEETAFFAAKTGIYEALDRMQQSNATTIAANVPTAVPSNSGGVLYLINAGSSLTVKPWDETNTYYDTEFCHEGYTLTGMASRPPDVPCFADSSAGTHALPTGNTWYSQVNSNYPWSGTSAAMPYEWVRINWKENKTQSYLSGQTTPTVSNYAVNSGTGVPAGTPVCWNGSSEILLSTPTGVTPAYTSCEEYQTCGSIQPSLSTPVLMVTALSVTSNGSRQMVQAEAALNPPTLTVQPCGLSDAYGFFAFGGSCASPGLTIGGNASVDGFNSATGPYSVSNSLGLGNVGTNGGAIAQGTSTTIGGTVTVPNVGDPLHPAPGACPDDFSITGHATYGHLAPLPQLVPKPTITIPPDASTQDEGGSATPLVPGNYRNISVGQGANLTLTAPGTYNVDCISVGSHGSITISPPSKAVTINVTGTGCDTSPITFNSHASLYNCAPGAGSCTTPGVASNLQINYAGTGTITMEGGAGCYAILDAPNAPVVLHGGADYYGTIMANTIDDLGGTSLHFDVADTTISGHAASTATATAGGSYNILAFHSLPY
jgi:hypothetical protein